MPPSACWQNSLTCGTSCNSLQPSALVASACNNRITDSIQCSLDLRVHILANSYIPEIIQDWIFNPDYFTLLGSIMETADHLSFAFTKGGQVINAFHRKEPNQTHYFQHLENDITGTAVPMPLNADAGGNVYFADEPGMYIAAVQSSVEYNNLSEAEVLEQWRTEKPLGYEIYNRISEFDNPVILIGKYIF